MTMPRLAARRLVFLLLLPGCHTWRPVTLAPNTDYKHDGSVRVERRDQVANSAVAGGDSAFDSWVIIHGARVDRDSLVGRLADGSTRHAVAVANVRKAEERHFSGGRTTLLVAGIGAGIVGGLLALASGSLGTPVPTEP